MSRMGKSQCSFTSGLHICLTKLLNWYVSHDTNRHHTSFFLNFEIVNEVNRLFQDFGTVLYERFKAGTMCNQLILELGQMQFDLSVVYLVGTLILVNGWKKFVYLAAVKEGEILAVKYVIKT